MGKANNEDDRGGEGEAVLGVVVARSNCNLI